MKYVHVYSGLESAEVDEGALHWPWVAPDRVEVHDRVARARTAAREVVADRVARARTAPLATSTGKAAAKVRTTRARAARAAAKATSSSSTPATSTDPEDAGDA